MIKKYIISLIAALCMHSVNAPKVFLEFNGIPMTESISGDVTRPEFWESVINQAIRHDLLDCRAKYEIVSKQETPDGYVADLVLVGYGDVVFNNADESYEHSLEIARNCIRYHHDIYSKHIYSEQNKHMLNFTWRNSRGEEKSISADLDRLQDKQDIFRFIAAVVKNSKQ